MVVPYAGFNKFTSQFNIWPGLISNDEVLIIFRALTKDKPSSEIAAMNFDDFKMSFIRIALVSKTAMERELTKELTDYE